MIPFQLSRVIKNVDCFLAKRTLLVYYGNQTLHIDDLELDFESLTREKCNRLVSKNRCTYLRFSSGDLYCVNLTHEIIHLQPNVGINVFDSGYIVITDFDYQNFTSKINFIQESSQVGLLKDAIPGLVKIHGGKIYQFHSNDLFCYSLAGLQLWKHHSTSYALWGAGIKKFLGVAHNRLWILTKQGRILVLNIDDGSFVKTFQWEAELINGENFMPYPTEIFMHPDDKHLYCLRNYFIKINTETLEIERQVFIRDEMPGNSDLAIRNSSYQGDYISFSAMKAYTGALKYIGLFDYRKEEFVWVHQLLEEKEKAFITASATPQLAGNKLYILDSENTLRIFERDAVS